MNALTFTINGPPVPKERARYGQGRFYTPKETSAYEALIAQIAMVSAVRQRWARTDGEVLCHVVAYVMPAPKLPDADNILKAVLDGVTKSKAVWSDDVVCADVRCQRIVLPTSAVGGSRAEVRIEVIGE